MDNGAMKCFFGILKVDIFYGKKFENVEKFIQNLNDYIYWGNEKPSLKLKEMSPARFRAHSHTIYFFNI